MLVALVSLTAALLSDRYYDVVTHDRVGDMFGRSPAIQRVFEAIRRAAHTRFPVLLVGETGTGKDVAATAVHVESGRPGPLVAVNVASLSDTLFESELFGYVRGAFTGAEQDRKGAFEAAGGGTIFLDEVGELTMSQQAAVLRVIDTGEVRRVGSHRSIPVDVRVVAATNRDLPGMVEAGTFREDLFYRLAALPIVIPPLRERPEDIITLASHFLKREAPGYQLAPDAVARLERGAWPGNVRELYNVLARCVTMNPPGLISGAQVKVATGPEPARRAQRTPTALSPPKRAAMEASELPFWRSEGDREEERRMLEALLRAHEGKVTVVARELGITVAALRVVMDRYGLDANDFRPPNTRRR